MKTIKDKQPPGGIDFAFNLDCTQLWAYFLRIQKCDPAVPLTREQILGYYEQFYGDAEFTDYLFCPNGLISFVPSRYLTTIAEKRALTEENGIKVDYTQEPSVELVYRTVWKARIDHIGIGVEWARSKGYRPWVTVRMNDAHMHCAKTGWLRSQHLYAHPKWTIIHRPDGKMEYFDECFNYNISEVREMYLGYLGEMLERYDMDGLELDFSREPYCFPPEEAEASSGVMTQFFAAAAKLVADWGKRRGHRIMLSTLVPASPGNCRRMGFDLGEIARLGYIDRLAAGPRWDTLNTDMPFDEWRKILPSGFPFGAKQEVNYRAYIPGKEVWQSQFSITESMAYGQAAAFVSAGADFIYLFNYFGDNGCLSDLKRPNKNDIGDSLFRATSVIKRVYNEFAHPERMDTWTRCVPVTYDDFMPLGVNITRALPMDAATEIREIKFQTGRIKKGQRTVLTLQTSEPVDAAVLAPTVNGITGRLLAEPLCDKFIVAGNAVSFEYDGVSTDLWATVVIPKTSVPVTLDYIAVTIFPVQPDLGCYECQQSPGTMY